MLKTRDKLLIAALQSHLGVNAIKTAHINQRKEQIANLLLCTGVGLARNLYLNLGNILLYLIPDIFLLFPVEPRACSLLAYAECLYHRG